MARRVGSARAENTASRSADPCLTIWLSNTPERRLSRREAPRATIFFSLRPRLDGRLPRQKPKSFPWVGLAHVMPSALLARGWGPRVAFLSYLLHVCRGALD